MDPFKEIVNKIELHSVEGITKCFSEGVSPNHIFKGEPLIYELISEYTRSPRFKDCVRVFVDNGLEFKDEALLSVLLDDAAPLNEFIGGDPGIIHKMYTLRSAYTPLYDATLLHICAEFNHVNCAEILVKHGADVDAKAGFDEHGFGGQTPVFHTVNQNSNQSEEMMHFLLSNGTDLSINLIGLIWGKGYEWETFIPAVNPISYAMMGLLPQMHRDENTISKTVSILLKHNSGIDYQPENVPNKYLKPKY